MNYRTREALRASIKHWEEVAAAPDPKDIKITSEECALCRLFVSPSCRGCPVSEKVGDIFCHRTPYHSVYVALNYWKRHGAQYESDFRKAAQKELEFLKSLEPQHDPAQSNT